MLATERQNYIVTKIKEEGGVEVEKLAKELDVSLMTIRRDLQHLSEEGWIERCHGGAIAKKEVPYTKKISVQGDEKKRIAKAKEGDNQALSELIEMHLSLISCMSNRFRELFFVVSKEN